MPEMFKVLQTAVCRYVFNVRQRGRETGQRTDDKRTRSKRNTATGKSPGIPDIPRTVVPGNGAVTYILY